MERSIDGQSWREFAQLLAALESSEGRNYLSQDFTAPATRAFYRLRVVDLDGSYRFGPIREVNPWSVGNDLVLFPNPLQEGLLYLQWDQPADIDQIEVYDLRGRIQAVIVADTTLSHLQLAL